MQNDSAADGEAADGTEHHDLGEFRTQVQGGREQRTDREQDADNVEPQLRTKPSRLGVAELNLQQHGGGAD